MGQAPTGLAQVGGERQRACACAATGLTIPQLRQFLNCSLSNGVNGKNCFHSAWQSDLERNREKGRGRGRKRAWEELDGEMEEGEPPPLSELLLV